MSFSLSLDRSLVEWLNEWAGRIDEQDQVKFRKTLVSLLVHFDLNFSKPTTHILNTETLPDNYSLYINLNTREVFFDLLHYHYKKGCDYIGITLSELRVNFFSRFNGKNYFFGIILSESQDLINDINEVSKKLFRYHVQDEFSSQHISKSLLHSILALWVQALDIDDESGKENKRAEQFRKIDLYLSNHLYKSSQEIADDIGLSIQYINRICRTTHSMSFKEYSTTKRLERSRYLLIQSKKSIQEIAEMSGFTASPYFIKCFNERFMITPLQFRKVMSETGLSDDKKIELHKTYGLIKMDPLEIYEDMQSGPDNQKYNKYMIITNLLDESVYSYIVDQEGKHNLICKITSEERSSFSTPKDQCWIIKDRSERIITAFMSIDEHSIGFITKKTDRRSQVNNET